jgi:hypothetical protein
MAHVHACSITSNSTHHHIHIHYYMGIRSWLQPTPQLASTATTKGSSLTSTCS